MIDILSVKSDNDSRVFSTMRRELEREREREEEEEKEEREREREREREGGREREREAHDNYRNDSWGSLTKAG